MFFSIGYSIILPLQYQDQGLCMAEHLLHHRKAPIS